MFQFLIDLTLVSSLPKSCKQSSISEISSMMERFLPFYRNTLILQFTNQVVWQDAKWKWIFHKIWPHLHGAADKSCSSQLCFVLLQCVFLYTRRWLGPLRERCPITGIPTSGLPSSSCASSSSCPCLSPKKSESRSTQGTQGLVRRTSGSYMI